MPLKWIFKSKTVDSTINAINDLKIIQKINVSILISEEEEKCFIIPLSEIETKLFQKRS